MRGVLVGVALLIGNRWIRLHWQFLGGPGRGARRGARARVRLDRMARCLTRAIAPSYGGVTAVDPPAT